MIINSRLGPDQTSGATFPYFQMCATFRRQHERMNLRNLKTLLLIYMVCCCVDSLIVRNVKKKVLYARAKRCALTLGKELVVLGSPHLDLRTGGVISYITEKTMGPTYGCGDVCVDIAGCSKCCKSYTGDILDFLKTKRPKSCVLFSSGVLEFTENFPGIKKEIERTCVANFTDYYFPLNITWFAYGCAANNSCGLFKGLPKRVFWRDPFGSLHEFDENK